MKKGKEAYYKTACEQLEAMCKNLARQIGELGGEVKLPLPNVLTGDKVITHVDMWEFMRGLTTIAEEAKKKRRKGTRQ